MPHSTRRGERALRKIADAVEKHIRDRLREKRRRFDGGRRSPSKASGAARCACAARGSEGSEGSEGSGASLPPLPSFPPLPLFPKRRGASGGSRGRGAQEAELRSLPSLPRSPLSLSCEATALVLKRGEGSALSPLLPLKSLYFSPFFTYHCFEKTTKHLKCDRKC